MAPAMFAALVMLASAAAAGEDEVGARIARSASAAEAFQGPLDGTWTLRDLRGRALYVFQIADPVGGEGSLQVAWRNHANALGPVTRARRGAQSLSLDFTVDGRRVRVALRGDGRRGWRGELTQGGTVHPVSLRRAQAPSDASAAALATSSDAPE